MPNTLRELYDHISKECHEYEMSTPQFMYAVGWIFYDVFERADHESKNGAIIGPADFDRYAKDIPENKISRDLAEAQQSFGRAAADFMEAEIQSRIKIAIDNSVVAVVKANTSGWQPFLVNVAAGVVAGVLFAVITLGAYFFVRVDPSLTEIAKGRLEPPSTSPPAASPSPPTPPKSPPGK